MRIASLLVLIPLATACTSNNDTAWDSGDTDDSGTVDTDTEVTPTDADGDGFDEAEDCDDDNAAVNPGATESCNDIDDNCDGSVDEAGATGETTTYADTDGDGFGDADDAATACDHAADRVADDTDCDDTTAEVNPGATEACNEIDDNCDGEVDEAGATGETTTYADSDDDGFGDPESGVDACTHDSTRIDDSSDCDDTNADINPDATEVCNELDDNCDGATDEAGATGEVVSYADVDGDSYGDPNSEEFSCSPASDRVTNTDDCDDTSASINPDGAEICNELDDDCNDSIDDGDAVGTGAACAVDDCQAAYDLGFASGSTWVAPNGADAFEAFCDQDSLGGGWTVVWKNHGGAKGGEASNADLLDGTRDDGAIDRHDGTLVSGVNGAAWAAYKDAPQHEWAKAGSLWNASDALEKEHAFRLVMGDVTWGEILAVPSGEFCTQMDNAIEVYFGDTFLGKTDYVNSYQSDRNTFGLANSGNFGEDSCGQTTDNLINDPDRIIGRIDGSQRSLSTVRHLFSYNHNVAGADSSRCQFGCWDETNFGGYYDGFTWLVR